jgi:hypothetical protein
LTAYVCMFMTNNCQVANESTTLVQYGG